MNRKSIEINNITFGYQKDENLIENLSLHFNEGETVGIIGSNGAGKSTLLKLMVGLHDIKKGSIIINGIKMDRKSKEKIRNEVGYTFQDADSQLFMTTVWEDVAFGPRNMGYAEDRVKAAVKQALKEVEAWHLADRQPYKLSGGEKRAVTFATVLSMEPSILVLDEPTTGLDPRARRNLIDMMKKLEHTKIIATHDMDMALEVCDRVLIMQQGRVVMEGNPHVVFKDMETLRKYHLEQPLSMQGCMRCSRLGG